MIDLEKEQLRLKLIETQMMVLQYQHKEVSEKISSMTEPKVEDELPVNS